MSKQPTSQRTAFYNTTQTVLHACAKIFLWEITFYLSLYNVCVPAQQALTSHLSNFLLCVESVAEKQDVK